MDRLEREKALYRYSAALEGGDFETVESVLRKAEDDPTLETMILEMNAVYEGAYGAPAADAAAETVRLLLRETMSSGLGVDLPEADIPPLTVSDVAARLHADAALRPQNDGNIAALTRQLRQVDMPLPPNLNRRGVANLFETLGLKVDRRVQDLFRETAIFLSMGREQGMTRLAAARRQRQAKQPAPAEGEGQE